LGRADKLRDSRLEAGGRPNPFYKGDIAFACLGDAESPRGAVFDDEPGALQQLQIR